jgi:Outer membrane lipoprotein-sorting protein
MIPRRRFAAVLLGVAALMTPGAARADGPSADEIAKKTLEHDTFGFEGSQIKARLVLFEGISKKGADNLIRSVIRFTAPATIAGTSFLMVQHQGAPDEQHIYLPRMKTTRRIGGTGEREGSFMGSDFSYADLERKDLREATYTRLPDEAIGKDGCFHIEAVPKGQSSYAKLSLWIRQRDFIPLRVQMFDKDNKLLKTTFTRRIKEVDGKPVVTETHTENAQTSHKTDLVIDEIEFKPELSDALFTPAALSH